MAQLAKLSIRASENPAKCITTTKTMKAEIQWTIQKFQSQLHNKEVGESIKSLRFHATEDEDVKWLLIMFPNGNCSKQNKGCLGIFVRSDPSLLEKHIGSMVQFKFSLIDEDSNQELWKSPDNFHHKIPLPKTGFGYPNIPKANLLNTENLLIICKVEYAVEKLEAMEEHFNNSSEPPNLAKDLLRFSTTIGSSDVTFVIGDKEFPANKSILSARSPVFAAMFQHDMKEAALNRVEIVDIEPDIFQAVLRFIYTDQVDLTVENATGLLAAANRYFLDLLKWKCEKFLAQDLSIKNCCDRLILADTQDAPNLKKAAGSIIRKFSTKLKKTNSWKKMMKQASPELLREIIESFLIPS